MAFAASRFNNHVDFGQQTFVPIRGHVLSEQQTTIRTSKRPVVAFVLRLPAKEAS